jgi:hypothetical protein
MLGIGSTKYVLSFASLLAHSLFGGAATDAAAVHCYPTAAPAAGAVTQTDNPQMAVCSYITRTNAMPVLAALLPQPEELDGDRQVGGCIVGFGVASMVLGRVVVCLCWRHCCFILRKTGQAGGCLVTGS